MVQDTEQLSLATEALKQITVSDLRPWFVQVTDAKLEEGGVSLTPALLLRRDRTITTCQLAVAAEAANLISNMESLTLGQLRRPVFLDTISDSATAFLASEGVESGADPEERDPYDIFVTTMHAISKRAGRFALHWSIVAARHLLHDRTLAQLLMWRDRVSDS